MFSADTMLSATSLDNFALFDLVGVEEQGADNRLEYLLDIVKFPLLRITGRKKKELIILSDSTFQF